MSKKSRSYPRRRLHYAWVILIVGVAVTFTSVGVARFGYTPVLPAMQSDLGLNNTEAGAIATATMVGYLLLSAIGGAFASRFGPRRVIGAGLAIAGGSMLMTGLADGFEAAAAWRTLTGVGSGASNIPVMALMAAWFTPRKRGLAAGIVVAGSAGGLIFVGPLVPRILDIYGTGGWRICWFIFGTLTLLAAVLSLILLRNRPADKGLNPLGAAGTGPQSDPGPLRWVNVYRSRRVWHLGLVYIAFGFAYIIYLTFFVKYLIAEAGYTPAAAGDLFMLMGWVSLLCGLIWGAVSDRFGRRAALIGVYLVHTLSFALFAFRPGTGGLIISALLFGLSAWSIPAIMAAAAGDLLGPRLAPAGLGFLTLFFGVGQALGPSAGGIIGDAAGSLRPAFLTAAAVSLLGVLGASFLRPVSKRRTRPG